MIKAIDFFSGAGGLTRGLLDAGVQVCAGVDLDGSLAQTYNDNNKPSIFLQRDIKDVNIHLLRQRLGITDTDAVLYAACSPCQPFSTLNNKAQRRNEKSVASEVVRRSLLLDFARVVEDCPPDFILVENVPGLGREEGKDVFDEFLRIIATCGFAPENMFTGRLDAAYYGVPQVRKRFILLASRHGAVQPPVKDKEQMKLKGQLERFTKIEAGQHDEKTLNHVTRPLAPHHRRIIESVPKNGGSRRDVKDTSILLKCHQDKPNVHKDVFGRMSWEKPSPTLTCRCTEVYCGRFTHPDQDRGISQREAAAIQTFPDDYKFYGNFTQISRQIGNAVPVNFAKRLGEAILKTNASRHAHVYAPTLDLR